MVGVALSITCPESGISASRVFNHGSNSLPMMKAAKPNIFGELGRRELLLLRGVKCGV